MKKKLAILDYQMSNMFSVRNALEFLGFEPLVVSEASESLSSADGAVLPGVGAFGEAMQRLKDQNLISAIKDFIRSGKPFMGICLGLQLLFSESDEFGITPGLDIIKGRVESFAKNEKIRRIPHTGWNKIYKKGGDSGEYMYFVHSFYANPQDKSKVETTTEYEGFSFCSSVRQKNVYACQFHPEKSGPAGLKILKEFFNN